MRPLLMIFRLTENGSSVFGGAVDHRCIRHHIHGLLDGDHDIQAHGSGRHGGICIVIGHRNGGGTYGSCRRYGRPEGSLSGLARLQEHLSIAVVAGFRWSGFSAVGSGQMANAGCRIHDGSLVGVIDEGQCG